MDTELLVAEVTVDLTDYLWLGDRMRTAGLHRQAECYDLFLEGRMPYEVMLRHFERQRIAAFRNHGAFWDKVKELPGKLKNIVKEQAGKWEENLTKSIKESLPALKQMQEFENRTDLKTKKSIWQKALDTFASKVMDDYQESLAALKGDDASLNEFVGKIYNGAMEKARVSLAKTVPAYVVAFMFGGPAAVGAMFFRKALFRAAKAAIRAGDAILTRTLGEGYTEKKEKVKEVAKEKTREIVMGVVRKFKSKKDAGEKIGAATAAMALAMKAGRGAKDALQAAHGYIEKRYGKNWADGMDNVLKALAIGGMIRGGAGAIGVVAEWFAEDPEMAELAAAVKSSGKMVLEDPDTGEMLGVVEVEPEDVTAESFMGFKDEGQLSKAIGGGAVAQLEDGRMSMHLGGDNFVAIDDDKLAKLEEWYETRLPRAERRGTVDDLQDLLQLNLQKLGDRLEADELPDELKRTLQSVQRAREEMAMGEGF